MRKSIFLIKKNHGFTLLELMIASGVVIITLAGLLATYVACLELEETTKNSNLALNSARQVLEEVRSVPFLTIFGAYDGYTFQVPGFAANSSQGYVYINNSNPDLLNVTVGVCWRQKSSRIIGECQNAGGVISFSDTDSNGILDSPVQLNTLMGQR